MKKQAGMFVLVAAAILLSGCLKLAPDVSFGSSKPEENSTQTKRSTTIQFSHPNLAEVQRVVRQFASQHKMASVASRSRVVGSGWTQESYELTYYIGRVLRDKYTVFMVLLYRNRQATIQLKPSNATHSQYTDLERSLLEVLRVQFGAGNVTKVSD